MVFALLGLAACGASTGGAGGPSATSPAPLTAPAQPSAGAVFSWPNGVGAAVSLTYDDAIPTDVDVAAPALDRHHLHGTFFLTGTSAELGKRPDAWRAIARAGHELASHTMFHPCDRSHDFVKKGYALEDYDVDRMRRELDESIALLRSLGADHGPYTFAYPCGTTWIGENHTSYVPLAEQVFLAARGVGSTIADPRTEPLGNIPGIGGDGKTGDELIALVRAAAARSGWLVLLFHGVGGDYLTVDAASHDQLLAYLDANRQTVWTDTFGAVARHVAAARGR
ncbi:MAG TPA: polysaccharide deacetylase family protein [Polyangiaceae bacterium]|nr:polysaccharide deacetylase family protein [Polyangiaceae bacterium]